MPGILSGSLLVFALSISSYIVPALMGGFRVGVLPDPHLPAGRGGRAWFQFRRDDRGHPVPDQRRLRVLVYLRIGARRSGGLA